MNTVSTINKTFIIDKTTTGKPCILLGEHKYRETTTMNNRSGDVTWTCLGSTCKANVKTNPDRTRIIYHHHVHTGDHPKTIRNISPCLVRKMKIADDSFSSLPSSPLAAGKLKANTKLNSA